MVFHLFLTTEGSVQGSVYGCCEGFARASGLGFRVTAANTDTTRSTN